MQDSANRPLDNLGSWIPSPIEISIGLIGFNRHTDHKHVHMIIHAHTQAYTVRLSKHIHTLSTSVCRLKPIKPIEISIGARIQDPRSKIAQGSSLGILDLGSWSRLKFQSVQSVSIGIQDSANRPLDNLGSWIPSPIEISIGLIGFNRHTDHKHVHISLNTAEKSTMRTLLKPWYLRRKQGVSGSRGAGRYHIC